MSGGIDIQWEREKGVLVAALVGRVDGGNAEEFQRLLEAGIEPGDTALLLDLKHLAFISSAGLRVGLMIARKFNEPGKRFGVCTLPTHIRGVITITGFDHLIAVYESRAAALSAIVGSPSSDDDDHNRRTEEKISTLRSVVDINPVLDIVGSDLQEITDFTIEKYEFRHNTTLSAELREAGAVKIKDALWQRIELMKQERQQWLKRLFHVADKTLIELFHEQS